MVNQGFFSTLSALLPIWHKYEMQRPSWGQSGRACRVRPGGPELTCGLFHDESQAVIHKYGKLDQARDNINDYQQPDEDQAQMPVQTTAATAGHFPPLLQNAGQPQVPITHLFILRWDEPCNPTRLANSALERMVLSGKG